MARRVSTTQKPAIIVAGFLRALNCALMKISAVFAALFAFSSLARAQESKPLSVARIPLRADAPPLFAPRGWMIEKRISGDLNRDKIDDLALVLVENKPAKYDVNNPAPRARALVVLLKEGKGWHRVGFNSSMLLGTRDGGALYGVVETPVDVSIKRGVLLIDQENGSREVTNTTHKFRLDKRTPRLYLIGLELSASDRLLNGGRRESANFLMGMKKITLIKGETEVETTRTVRVSRKLRTLESVRVEERYSG